MGTTLSIGDWASLATAVGIFFAAGGLFAQSRLRKLAIAQSYVERYWHLDDLMADEGATWDIGAVLTSTQRQYLKLCEDEFEIARLGWIDATIWDQWHLGVRSIISGRTHLVENYTFLTLCETSGPTHDGSECAVFLKWPLRRRVVARVERLIG